MAKHGGTFASDRLLAVVLACLIFCEVGTAAERSELPPLIERERFFADPDIAAPRAESDQMVAALRARHLPVEYLLFDDEGHGFAKPLNNIVAWAAAERFLAQRVRGVRYQESMSTDAVARFKAVEK